MSQLRKKIRKKGKKQKSEDTLHEEVKTEQQHNVKTSVVVAVELSNGEQNVLVQSFSSATADDMRPSIRKKTQ